MQSCPLQHLVPTTSCPRVTLGRHQHGSWTLHELLHALAVMFWPRLPQCLPCFRVTLAVCEHPPQRDYEKHAEPRAERSQRFQRRLRHHRLSPWAPTLSDLVLCICGRVVFLFIISILPWYDVIGRATLHTHFLGCSELHYVV